jgi:hypothetical protein
MLGTSAFSAQTEFSVGTGLPFHVHLESTINFTGSLLRLPGQESGAANHLAHRNIVGCGPPCKRLSPIRTGRANQRPSV